MQYIVLMILMFFISACSTNPATGERQFTALMSEEQERRVGADNHPKALAAFGGEYEAPKLQNYVKSLGQSIAKNTERENVDYTFTLLDTPVVNAFAVPGGYIYVTRGILTLANDEAELAAVIAHEIGHITGRHSAERASQSFLVGLAGAAASIALDSSAANQALGLGQNLYLSSYSREQEREADYLGVRYLSREGYQPLAMADFLSQLQRDEAYQKSLKDDPNTKATGGGLDVYFRSHPLTSERVQNATAESKKYLNFTQRNRDKYLDMIDGMIYGESPSQGVIRGQTFLHTDLNFKFTAPDGYDIINQPDKIIIKKDDTAAIMGIDPKGKSIDPKKYLTTWKPSSADKWGIEEITVNGFKGANAFTNVTARGKHMILRHVAILGPDNRMFRFQILIPKALSKSEDKRLFDMVFSFDDLNNRDRELAQPFRIKVFTAKTGESINAVAERMPSELKNRASLFRTINGLSIKDNLITGRKYKTVYRR